MVFTFEYNKNKIYYEKDFFSIRCLDDYELFKK